MNKQEVIHRIGTSRLLPVIRAGTADEAKSVIDAVVRGGCGIVEITLTIPGAVELIREVAGNSSELLVAAGTVSSAADAEKCVSAGAGFIVSPWIQGDVIEFCNSAGVPVLPGALTPTEVRTAMKAGADIVKVFPIDAMGGASYIRTLRSVMPGAMLIPTGGVTVENAPDFIKAGAFAVGVGSDLVSVEQLRAGDTSMVISRIRDLVTRMNEFGESAAA